MFPEDAENESDPDDENDDLDVAAHEKKQTVKVCVCMCFLDVQRCKYYHECNVSCTVVGDLMKCLNLNSTFLLCVIYFECTAGPTDGRGPSLDSNRRLRGSI